jgi:hypothetical protein
MDPHRGILPIVKYRSGPEPEILELLGTGFIVADPPVCVTAAHVLKSKLAVNEFLGCAFIPQKGQKRIGSINIYHSNSQVDIAAFGVKGLEGIFSFAVLDKKIETNVDVLTYEFSSSGFRSDNRGERKFGFGAATHKGNVMCHYFGDFPAQSNIEMLDTSFPALQGASGAPVVRASDRAVAGMLVANHERHLLPAQTVKVTDGDGAREEISYFLPTGRAIASPVLARVLADWGINVELVTE